MNGSNGSSGAAGASGVNGAGGTSGVNGTTGSTGAAGGNGANGANGTSGVNGTNGTSGAAGTSGVSFNGTSGISGGSFTDQPDYLVRTTGTLTVQSVNFLYVDTTNNYLSVNAGTSPAYTLQVGGDIYASGNIVAYSDQSVKDNVTTIPNALDKVKQMRGVTFTRNDHEDKEKIHAGVIAQEMEKAFPEVVFENPDGTKAVAYANIVSVLIEAIKEQQIQIDELKAKLK